MDTVLNLTFASSLTKLCEINTSFDSGFLRIAYSGLNRNNSFISKETFERCIQTIYNCPVVCNYDRDTDTLGGHDMELVRDLDGNLRIVNVTTPVGVVPESAHWEWMEFEEEDGTVHEYLCTEVLLWKRQEAYKKIKDDGITSHSMEIRVKDGETIDGIYHINDFEFTAFTLIGVAPCFEGSALEMFSKQDFKQQLSEMMQELKESYTAITTSKIQEDDDIKQQILFDGRRKKALDEKMKLAANYGIDINNLDFSIEDFNVEELMEKFEALKAATEVEESQNQDFALASNILEELNRELDACKIQREWGECTRYWFVDYDSEVCEVYCWDTNDWLLYGFTYEVNGDSVDIDFESKKRKKYIIADFDEGEQASPFAQAFSLMEQKIRDYAAWEEKYQDATTTIHSMETELGELRQYKEEAEFAIADAARNAVFEKFTDLIGIEAFESLRSNCSDYDIETIEEKCFAIRGREGTVAKFSHEVKTPKLKIEKTDVSKEPYGGLFVKYGTNKTL